MKHRIIILLFSLLLFGLLGTQAQSLHKPRTWSQLNFCDCIYNAKDTLWTLERAKGVENIGSGKSADSCAASLNILLPRERAGSDYSFSIKARATDFRRAKIEVRSVDDRGECIKIDTCEISDTWQEYHFRPSSSKARLMWVKIVAYCHRNNGGGYVEFRDSNTTQLSITEFSRQNEPLLMEAIEIPKADFLRDIASQLQGKKIVAVGETVHGNRNVTQTAMDVAKAMVLYNNCKLVLLELPISMTLTLNSYVKSQCDLSDAELERVFYNMLFSSTVMRDFCKWLREYNMSLDNKVELWGMDKLYSMFVVPMYIKVFEADRKSPLSPAERKVCDMIVEQDKIDKRVGRSHSFAMRDEVMASNLEQLRELFCPPGATTFVYAHFMHVTRQMQFGILRSPMGSLLKPSLKNDYFVVGLTLAGGRLGSTDIGVSHEGLALEDAVVGSVERLSIEKGSVADFLYYPSPLPATISTMRYAGSKLQERDNFVPIVLRRAADAMLFVNTNGEPSRIEMRKPSQTHEAVVMDRYSKLTKEQKGLATP